jgi:hypothetical protein
LHRAWLHALVDEAGWLRQHKAQVHEHLHGVCVCVRADARTCAGAQAGAGS